MNGYPIEVPEPNGRCIVCGSLTYNDDYCSTQCLKNHWMAMGYKNRRPLSEKKINAMFDQSEHEIPEKLFEGVELDIGMEQAKESRTNREWINDQEYLLGKDFKRMRRESND